MEKIRENKKVKPVVKPPIIIERKNIENKIIDPINYEVKMNTPEIKRETKPIPIGFKPVQAKNNLKNIDFIPIDEMYNK